MRIKQKKLNTVQIYMKLSPWVYAIKYKMYLGDQIFTEICDVLTSVQV